ncbi:hypothetical protein BDZ45DRAFT_215030 [Acephala macrosclerotiorum]|nr:hypothetical protein BDZ45DRAFT_215030 [Acephala macrosclerotiorum]
MPQSGIWQLGGREKAPSTPLSQKTVGLLPIPAGNTSTGVLPAFPYSSVWRREICGVPCIRLLQPARETCIQHLIPTHSFIMVSSLLALASLLVAVGA